MAGSSSGIRKPYIAVAVACCLLVIAVPAFAFQWSVTLPGEMPFTKCEVGFHDRSFNPGSGEVHKGQTYTWTSGDGGRSELTYVTARCYSAMQDRWVWLQGRTCDGKDFQGGVPQFNSCAADVTLKVCNKASNLIMDYHYGFCP